jgi:integrase/recombinase XerD
MPDDLWDTLFAAMGRNRDRAILALAVSTGARAAELLGMRGADIDWGNQLMRVIRKGTRAEQWLPASPDAFVWLRLYVSDIGGIMGSNDRVWRTVNRRRGAHVLLTYDALRAVFRRANTKLGSNWTMHDLRHTCAIRMKMSDVAFDASFGRFWDCCAATDWVSASVPVSVSRSARHAVA